MMNSNISNNFHDSPKVLILDPQFISPTLFVFLSVKVSVRKLKLLLISASRMAAALFSLAQMMKVKPNLSLYLSLCCFILCFSSTDRRWRPASLCSLEHKLSNCQQRWKLDFWEFIVRRGGGLRPQLSTIKSILSQRYDCNLFCVQGHKIRMETLIIFLINNVSCILV